MENNIHDKEFFCPDCHNKTLIPIHYDNILGISYDDICICEECAGEFKARPNYDFSVKFEKYEDCED